MTPHLIVAMIFGYPKIPWIHVFFLWKFTLKGNDPIGDTPLFLWEGINFWITTPLKKVGVFPRDLPGPPKKSPVTFCKWMEMVISNHLGNLSPAVHFIGLWILFGFQSVELWEWRGEVFPTAWLAVGWCSWAREVWSGAFCRLWDDGSFEKMYGNTHFEIVF